MNLNFASLFGQAQKVQEEIQKIQQELKIATVSASAGGEMVTVQVNGQLEIVDIKIDPEIMKTSDFEFLSELVKSACNQALTQAKNLSQEKMNSIAGGILSHLPPGFKLPGF